ncbi:hypothetical protein O4215_10860 [Rhodococcus maanshanensis]|uniref:hypothetical protein n=1 Tax=Rhodococcus maanshanensis TaxID=183556 RepID=UPI0022B3B1CE|nr:hypothetical protein [Rhodococcus maanshanensis]MCZ4556077.1 hypothetical protein [Rhodococcus maanshanensis]
MNMRISTKRALAGAVAAAAIAIGVAAPAGAAADPLAPIAAAAAGAAVGDIAAPQGMTTQTLIAARNAGFPIYEEARVLTVQGPGTGPSALPYQMIEYRRVYDFNVLGSPSTKFVAVGAAAADTFYVNPAGDRVVRVNPHEVRQENVTGSWTVFDPTPNTFLNSPLVRLPDGGPSVGIAIVT